MAVHHLEVEVDLCTTCGGVWLDHGELEHILRQDGKGRKKGEYDIADFGDTLATGKVMSVIFEFIGDALS